MGTITILVTENGRRVRLRFEVDEAGIAPDGDAITHWLLRSWCSDGSREGADELVDLLTSVALHRREPFTAASGDLSLEINPFLCRLRHTGPDRVSDWVEVPTLDLLNALRRLRPLLREPVAA